MLKKLLTTFNPFFQFSKRFTRIAKCSCDDNHAGVISEILIQTEQSWDGITYPPYVPGTPEITVLKITIDPFTRVPWHEHAIPCAGYLLSGCLTVERKSDGRKHQLNAGEVLPEMVNAVHCGYTHREGAVVIVFYAGKKGIPLSALSKEV